MTTPELSTVLGGKEAVHRIFDAIADLLLKQKKVEINGFGTFEVVERKPRIARNPRTGERIDIPGKMAVKFKPAGALKRRAEQLPDTTD